MKATHRNSCPSEINRLLLVYNSRIKTLKKTRVHARGRPSLKNGTTNKFRPSLLEIRSQFCFSGPGYGPIFVLLTRKELRMKGSSLSIAQDHFDHLNLCQKMLILESGCS